MPSRTWFVVLDGQYHVIGEEERTYCGLEVPHGSDATFDQPAELHDECAALAGIEQLPVVENKPKGKAKSAATNDEA